MTLLAGTQNTRSSELAEPHMSMMRITTLQGSPSIKLVCFKRSRSRRPRDNPQGRSIRREL